MGCTWCGDGGHWRGLQQTGGRPYRSPPAARGPARIGSRPDAPTLGSEPPAPPRCGPHVPAGEAALPQLRGRGLQSSPRKPSAARDEGARCGPRLGGPSFYVALPARIQNGNDSGRRGKPQKESGTWGDPEAREKEGWRGWALGELEAPLWPRGAGLALPAKGRS